MVEELLGRLLETVLDARELHDELLGDGPTSPLGSFSARSKLCYALAIINGRDYSDINLIRRIRNAAAHFQSKGDGFETGFASQSVADRCRGLSLSESHPSLSARQQFELAVAQLVAKLSERTLIARFVADNINREFTLQMLVETSQGVRFGPRDTVEAYYDGDAWVSASAVPAELLPRFSPEVQARIQNGIAGRE